MVLLLCFTFDSETLALSQESQKILNNYQNYKQSGSPPATSKPYGSDSNPSNSHSSQTPSLSQTGNDSGAVIGVIIVIVIIIIIAGIAKSRGQEKTVEYKDIQRKGFSNYTKESVKEQKNGRCAICNKIPTHWEFDHINGRGDNDIRNCQGLCRDCHQDKTLSEER